MTGPRGADPGSDARRPRPDGPGPGRITSFFDRSDQPPLVRPRPWFRHAGDDDGQVLVLVIGVAVLAIAVAVTLAAVSGLLLERKRLVSVADNAAAFAAADVSPDDVYGAIGESAARSPAVSERGARESVEEYLGGRWVGAGGPELVDVVTDGTGVTVRLRTTAHPWLVGTFADVLGGDGIVVVGTGRARQAAVP